MEMENIKTCINYCLSEFAHPAIVTSIYLAFVKRLSSCKVDLPSSLYKRKFQMRIQPDMNRINLTQQLPKFVMRILY